MILRPASAGDLSPVSGAPRTLALALVLAGALAGCSDTAAENAPEPLPSPVGWTDTIVSTGERDARVVTVADGLEHPWGLAFLPNGDLLVTERAGRLRIIREGVLDPQPISGVPEVRVQGQGGLLDVALHPRFEENRLVYLTYSKSTRRQDATTALARGRLTENGLVDVEELFVADASTGAWVHYGSRLAFSPDGAHLFMSIGDRGAMQEAQSLENHQGTILRFDAEGGVPSDNPFVGTADALPEIWAYGIRSPQGLAFHPETGVLWESEHGPQGGDELNIIRRGANYGWPTITYGVNYGPERRPISEFTEMEGMEQPVHYWVPSIAASGLAFYTGDEFPEWTGSAFIGGLAGTQVARVELDGEEAVGWEPLFTELGFRIRDVRQGPDERLYLLTDLNPGRVLRIEPAGND